MGALDTSSTISKLPPVTGQDGEIIKRGRIRDVASAAAVFQWYYTADLLSSYQRTRVQEQQDGVPPLSEYQAGKMGYRGVTNVNWGLATQSHDEAEGPYNDVLESIDVFGTSPTTYGTEQERLNWEPVLSLGITRMLRKWDMFLPLWYQNSRLFVGEGLSFAMFYDDRDWRWRIDGQQHIKFARRVPAGVGNLQIVGCIIEMRPDELFSHVKNAEVATDEGWSVPEVLGALRNACGQQGIDSNDPQEWEKVWKDNDLYIGTTESVVKTVWMWVKETDGSCSFYIFRYDAEGDFLYKSIGKYHSMDRRMVAFMYGIGTNGDFQSIRGHDAKIFAPVAATNRLINKLLDAAVMAATPHLKTPNESEMNAVPYRMSGPFMFVEGVDEFLDTKMPDLATTLVPAIQAIQQILFARQSQFTGGSPNFLDKTERTKFEKEMQYTQQAKNATTGFNLFMSAWERLYKEIVRRIIDPEYKQSDPGGQQVWELRAWLLNQGVPLEAFYGIDVDGIEINTGIGKGSQTELKMITSDLFQTVFPNLDAEGQQIVLRWYVSARTNYRMGKILVPDQAGLRPPVEMQIANLENNSLVQNMPVEVLPNQNHDIHIQSHLSRLIPINTQLETVEITLEEAIPQMMPLYEHTMIHFQLLPMNSPNRPLYKETLQQLNEVITNGAKHLAKEQERAMEEGGGEQQPGMDPEQGTAQANMLVQLGQLDVKLQEVKNLQQAARERAETHAQDKALKDAMTAAKIKVMMEKAKAQKAAASAKKKDGTGKN